MPGQGYHVGIAKLICAEARIEFSSKLQMGVLFPDSQNAKAGSRRRSHFCGGGGMLYPAFSQLKNFEVQSWDSERLPSFNTDPLIEMDVFEATNKHLEEDDFKMGLRIHLWTDFFYDKLIAEVLFDKSRESEGIMVLRRTGEEMALDEFRRSIYAVYPKLDQLAMELAGIKAEDVRDVKALLFSVLKEEDATFISKYLNFNPEMRWEDSREFQREVIDELIGDTVQQLARATAHLRR